MNVPVLYDWATLWQTGMIRACGQGALAVAGVWVICRFFPRVSPAVRAALWWLACLKVIVSLAAAGPVPLPVLPAERPLKTPAIALPGASSYGIYIPREEAAKVDGPAIVVAPAAPPAAPAKVLFVRGTEEAMPLPLTPGVFPTGIFFCFWLTGVAFLLTVTGLHVRRVQRLVREAEPFDGLMAWEVGSALGLRRVPPVLVSERADCSLVTGLWCPVVVLCRADMERLSSEELRGLLAHEMAHVRRRDLWAGLIPNAARLLFFFNPLVWLACREYDLAREAACDAEALRVSGMPPAAYGHLLLKLSIAASGAAAGRRHSPVAALGAASPYGILLRRRLRGLQAIATGLTATSRWRAGLALALAAVALSLNPVRGTGAEAQRVLPADAVPGVTDNSAGATSARNAAESRPPVQAGVPNTAPVTGSEASFDLPIIVPKTLFPAAVAASVGREQTLLGSIAPSVSEPETRKEELSMLNVTGVRKPNLSAILAAAALTVAGTPAAAQEEAPAAAPAAPTAPAAAAPAAPQANAAAAPRYQYTLRRGNSFMTRTQDKAIGQAQMALAKAQPGDALVVDRDGKRYLITDAATLNRIKENYAQMDTIGKEMEALGKQMEAQAKPMEELGKQMEVFGKQMEAIGKQMEEQGKLMEAAHRENKPEADKEAIKARMKALKDEMEKPKQEMKALGKQMKDQMGEKMKAFGAQMREHGNRMRDAAKQAEERMTGIIDAAFQNNLAVEQPTQAQ